MNAFTFLVPQTADPHNFRSRIMDEFAQIERWAIDRLRAAEPKIKLPPMLGQKLEAVLKLTETRPELFNKASRAATILRAVKPYQELRSALAHSTLRQAGAADDAWFIFDNAVCDGAAPWAGRVTLECSELSRIINTVSDLENRLRQEVPSGD